MVATRACPICGSPLDSTVLQRAAPTCPSCGVVELMAADVPTLRYEAESTNEPVAIVGKTIPSTTINRRVGRFQVQGVLGQGAFGVVYRAYDPHLERAIALKVPRFAPDDLCLVERFLTEARAAARLRHPNIIAVYEAGRVEDELYIASELVDGGGLRERIPSSPLKFQQAAAWVRDVSQALAYAHSEGIVHRDIKPENILLGQDGRPKITDFGLAKLADDEAGQTVEGTILGTPAYMAPEQARGDMASVGPHSDQYSLGAVLYELLTGRRPFVGSPHEVLAKVVEGNPSAPSTLNAAVPRDLEAICLKAMSAQPQGRYSTATALADDLGRYLAGEAVLARPPGLVERSTKWCRRNRRESALLASLFVMAVLAGCWWWRENALAQDVLLRQAQQAQQDEYAANREAARALARRGDWAEALEFYDRAMPHAGSELLSLRIERARVLFPLGRRREITEELARFSRRTDLGDHRAVVLLMQADVTLSETGPNEQARDLLERALALNTLSKADRVYAQALQAESASKSITLLEKCLQEDPLYHRASAIMVLGLIHLGRFDDAANQLRYHRRFFAHDPAGAFLEAWHQTWVQDADGAARAIAELNDRFKEAFAVDQLRELNEYLKMQADLVASLEEVRPFGKDNTAGLLIPTPDLFASRLKIAQIQQRYGTNPVLGRFGLTIPGVQWYGRRWSTLHRATEELSTDQTEQAIAQLTMEIDSDPDGLLLLVRALAKVRRASAIWAQDKTAIAAMMEHLISAAEDAHRAAESQTGLTKIRRDAFLFATVLDAFHCHVLNEPRPDWIRERVTNNQRRLLLHMALELDEHERLTELVAATFHSLDPGCVLPLLHDWHNKNSQDPRPIRHLATWELRAGNHAAAVRFAETALNANQDDVDMANVRNEARMQMLELLKTEGFPELNMPAP